MSPPTPIRELEEGTEHGATIERSRVRMREDCSTWNAFRKQQWNENRLLLPVNHLAIAIPRCISTCSFEVKFLLPRLERTKGSAPCDLLKQVWKQLPRISLLSRTGLESVAFALQTGISMLRA
jgi:hypothetical protein